MKLGFLFGPFQTVYKLLALCVSTLSILLKRSRLALLPFDHPHRADGYTMDGMTRGPALKHALLSSCRHLKHESLMLLSPSYAQRFERVCQRVIDSLERDRRRAVNLTSTFALLQLEADRLIAEQPHRREEIESTLGLLQKDTTQ